MQELIKSDFDFMEYRLMQLKNGLRALLISDVKNIIDLNSLSDSESESETESEMSESDSSKEADSKSDIGESKDFPSWANKIGEEKMAACALCINVGSFSDPPEIQGLSHFLEHMVFMGSEKHPQENGFDEFIKKHGGSNNGSTDCEMTSFYLECSEKHLREGMDRFAQFFISPLMRKDAMTREREIIQSEFDMTVPSDDSRRWQLLSSLAPEGHPAGKFSWGNLITLRDNIDDDTLYEKVHEFRRRYYSAHRMTVAVQARLPLDTLEAYVHDAFTDVPTNNLPPDDFSAHLNTYGNPAEFNKLLWVKPVKDICEVHLTWILPPYIREYKSRPLDYIGWFLEHEGDGSLMSFLSKKVWGLECNAGNEESGFEQNSMYSSFSIGLILTEEGFDHVDQVVKTLFSYLAMLRKNLPSKAIFDEMDFISRMNFRYKTETLSSQYAEVLAESMHLYEPNHFIVGGELYLEYKPELITDVLNRLTPDTANVIIHSKKKDDSFYDKIEPWFQTLYKIEDIPSEWMQSWKSCGVMKEFHIPDPNPYITTNFDLLEIPEDQPQYPVKIIDDNVLEIWYRQDVKFSRPAACYSFYLLSPLLKESPLNAALLDVLITYFDVKFIGKIYPASQAELFFVNIPADLGIYLHYSGFNQKLPLLFEESMKLITKYLKTIKNEENRVLVEAIIKEKSRSHYNRCLKPEKLVKMARLSLLTDTYWTSVERFEQMKNITPETLYDFGNKFFTKVRILGLVQGNISESETRAICEKFHSYFNLTPIGEPRPAFAVAKLGLGEKYFRLKSFNQAHSNSVITNYYQAGPTAIRTTCIISIIMLLMEEPLFDTLRTKQQVGYDVQCTIRETFGVLGFSVKVYFQSNKFDPDDVDERIETFLSNFLETLKNMSKKELEDVKKTLCIVKSHADLQLNDEAKRNFGEICCSEYIFDRTEKEVKTITEITHKELYMWYKNHIRRGEDYKKLSVQVIGPPEPQPTKSTEENANFQITLSSGEGANKKDFVLDMDEYKSRREFYPKTNLL